MALQNVITIPPEERNRESGIRNAGAVPWGTHLCYFYDTKQDLIDILVPYFKAGLENNEFCIWITSEYLDEKEAEEAIGKAVPDFAQYLERGQIEIIPHTEWYLKDGVFNGQRVINAWIGKLKRALANGYDGMRVTGDTDWVGKRYWRKFTDYEKQVYNIIGEKRMIALCTYSLGRCGAGEIIDVVSKHQFALTTQIGDWVLIRSSERKRAEAEIRESEERFRSASQIASDVVYERDLQTGIATFYGDIDSHLGYEPGGYPRTMEGWREHIHPEDLAWFDTQSMDQLEPGVPYSIEYRMRKKDGTYMTWLDRIIMIWDEKAGRPLKFIGAATDITERKQAEEEIKKLAKFPSENPNPVLRVAKDGTILYANEASLPLLSVWGSQTGKPLPDYWCKFILDVLSSGSSTTIEIECQDRILSVTFAPVADAGYVNIYGLDITERKRVGHDLNERKKELKCLYGITNIIEKPGITLDELYQEVVNLLPQGWQYPEITCARITTDGDEFKTENYVETEWKQSADIMAHGAKVGAVEVNYLEARTEIDEGPFLKEERLLIDAVAERLGGITECKRVEGSQETALPVQSRGWRRLTPLQKRFVKSGFEGFKDQEIIELLLSMVLSPRESKRLAKKCIDEFQNLRWFLSASSQELQRVGISSPCMFCIKLLHELPMEVLKQKIIEKPVYKSPQEIIDYLSYSMRDLRKEVFRVIYLNNRNQIIDTADLFEGTLDSIPIHPREILDSAIKRNATALIFVHNHPTGDPTPSKTDKQLTRDLVFVGMILQIKVLDHIIIGENKYSSFAESGLIQKYEDDFLTMKIRHIPDTEVCLHG